MACGSAGSKSIAEADEDRPCDGRRICTANKKFELLYRDRESSPWQTCLSGQGMGNHYSRGFQPVVARYVRLNILDASNSPTIWEFRLFPPKTK